MGFSWRPGDRTRRVPLLVAKLNRFVGSGQISKPLQAVPLQWFSGLFDRHVSKLKSLKAAKCQVQLEGLRSAVIVGFGSQIRELVAGY